MRISSTESLSGGLESYCLMSTTTDRFGNNDLHEQCELDDTEYLPVA
jgi:hypothetical protein